MAFTRFTITSTPTSDCRFIDGFVTLAEPTAPMNTEAASAGVLDTPFGRFARLQILTIEDLFAGKKE